MSQLKDIRGRYSHHSGKLKADAIFSKRGGTVKIADFYEELSVKLSDKVKQLENGLKNVSEMESSIKNGTVQVDEDLKKTVTEINTMIQHTCNYFTEIIDMIDDLGKYTMDTMNQYLNCLKQANKQFGRGKAKEIENVPKKKHKLFHRGSSADEDEE
jgi:2-hydroxy-3-keto-5-methylthiopentenyl-1-phosphate phosphatase